MFITRVIVLISLIFVSVITFGQTSNSLIDITKNKAKKEKKISYRKQKRRLAKQQINQLKDGALLVRLKTKKNSIAALRKIGKDKLAEKLEEKQRKYNLKIVAAFKRNFKFCPTYFFFSDYSQNIRDRQFDKVIFLTDSLVLDTTIKFNNCNFLTAEFGTIEQDTAKRFSHYSYESDGNWNLKEVKNYIGGHSMSFGALIIKSDQLIQLRRPFPFYVRTFDSLPISRSPKKVVKKMNRKLRKYYHKRNK